MGRPTGAPGFNRMQARLPPRPAGPPADFGVCSGEFTTPGMVALLDGLFARGRGRRRCQAVRRREGEGESLSSRLLRPDAPRSCGGDKRFGRFDPVVVLWQ